MENLEPLYTVPMENGLQMSTLSHLDWYDQQSATYEDEQSAGMAFQLQSRCLRLSIMPDIGLNCTQYQYSKLMRYHHKLMQSGCPYMHMTFYWGSWDGLREVDNIKDELFLQIINRFRETLVSLKIVSDRNYLKAEVLREVLESCPQLEVLILSGMKFPSVGHHQASMTPTGYTLHLCPPTYLNDFTTCPSLSLSQRKTQNRSRIHTVHDPNQILSSNSLISDHFDNVTTLHVMLPLNNRVFLHLSPNLVHLTLGWDTDQCSGVIQWPTQNFPLLETLVLTSEREGIDLDLGPFLSRMPRLRALTLSPHVVGDISVLNWINRENLQHLDVWPNHVLESELLFITRFSNLENICIRGIYKSESELSHIPVLTYARRLALTWSYALNKFLRFFPNLVELELQATGSWNKKHAREINSLTSLERLILHEGVPNLRTFIEFCEDLKVPNVTVVTKREALQYTCLRVFDKRALNIRQLSLHAPHIKPCICHHLIQLMPNLIRLELTLQPPLDLNIYQNVRSRFPQCTTIHHSYKPYKSILNHYERLGGIQWSPNRTA